MKDIKFNPCPEFPYFGARYPDATCIDGILHDLDKCDDEGNLYEQGDNVPCPFCQTESFIEFHVDDFATAEDIPDDKEREEFNASINSRETILEYINKLREKYA